MPGKTFMCSSRVFTPGMFFLVSFFFNDTATTEIYTLSLHDALPICLDFGERCHMDYRKPVDFEADRKSTRLNSSHVKISYAVFCLKKNNNTLQTSYVKKKKTNNNTKTNKTKTK